MPSLLLLSAALAATQSPSCPADHLRRATLEETQAAWLDRFNALDLPCFLRFFAADATLFAPFRVDGRSTRVESGGVAAFWQKEVFSSSQADGVTRLNVRPQNVVTTRLGRDAALVTFHLSGGANPNRRSLVWRRDKGGWRIVHVHASWIAPPQP